MKENILIRPAENKDLDQVFKFINKLENEKFDYNTFKVIYENNIENSEYAYFVATCNEAVIGFAGFHTQNLLHHCGRVGEIQELYVDNDYRNKGIGKMLITQIERIANIKDLKSIEVTSNKARTENIEVYENLGFKLTHNKFTKQLI